jgi:hypothetical protein
VLGTHPLGMFAVAVKRLSRHFILPALASPLNRAVRGFHTGLARIPAVGGGNCDGRGLFKHAGRWVADAAIAPPHSRSCHAKFKLDTEV